jgi:murein DD-endopeptidase MepM/ murein hydrolase activator NlpD
MTGSLELRLVTSPERIYKTAPDFNREQVEGFAFYLIIDHGNAEYSMLAHFRQHTLKVAVGQQVAQGDLLGEMGNSGDTTGPHLHHQLQAGPDWEFSDALPHFYINGPGKHRDRGWFFEA